MKRVLSPIGVCAILLVVALGCGGDRNEAPAPQAEAPAQPAAQTQQPEAPTPAPQPAEQGATLAPDAEGVVHVTANDQMRYNAARIEVKAGQKIKIELKNVGSLPKEAMGHNMVVLKEGVDPLDFATKAAGAKASDYIPADQSSQIIAHTKLLGPGEAETIEFEVPGPGTYAFVCTFPGHAALMKGQLVVSA